MTKRTSNRSISPVRTSDAVSDNTDLRLNTSHRKHTAIRTLEMAVPHSLTALKNAFPSTRRANLVGQHSPENSVNLTLSP